MNENDAFEAHSCWMIHPELDKEKFAYHFKVICEFYFAIFSFGAVFHKVNLTLRVLLYKCADR